MVTKKISFLLRRALAALLPLSAIFVLSCDSENRIIVQDRPTDYFPLKKGMFQIYDVSETVYTLGQPVQLSYQLKTVITDSIDRGDGSFAFVQMRYRRSELSQPWQYSGTWAVRADGRELLINEDNILYVKFRTPLMNAYTWNGNAYNDQDEDTYLMEYVKEPQTIGFLELGDCIVINQEDNQDFVVYLDERKEIYARGIGLVEHSIRQLHYCTQTELGCLGQQVVDEGVERTQTIVSYGVE